MKTPHSQFPIALLVLAIAACLLISCKGTEYQMSLDFSKLKVKDKVNNDEYANKPDPNFNMAIMIWLAMNGSGPEDNIWINSGLEPTDYLHHGGMSFVANQIQAGSGSSASMTPPPSWVDALRIYTGVELIHRSSHEGLVNINLRYLKLPAYVMHIHPLGKGHAFGGLGPYVAYGLGGKTKLSFGGTTEKHKSFDSDEGYKRFDAGINWTIGYRFENSLIVRLGFDIGMVNIAQPESEFKDRNRTFGINVAMPVDVIREKLKLN